jgi:hypothetical protein
MNDSIEHDLTGSRVLLFGADRNQTIEKRLQVIGCDVIAVTDRGRALDLAHHQRFTAAVLLSDGSLLDIAETVFNLRDLNRSMKVIILIERAKNSNRFLRQLIEHPIEGATIMTRRELQQILHRLGRQEPGAGR